MKKIGSIKIAQLTSTKTGNFAFTLVSIYFVCIGFYNYFAVGVLDFPNLILGLTFLSVSIMNAKKSPLVLSGILTGFLGVVNLLCISNVLRIDTAWYASGLLTALILLLELTNQKIGKASAKAKTAVIVPMLSLFFMFILALANLNPVMYVDWSTQFIKFLNYIALMCLTGMLSFDMLGWKLLKKNQGLWISILGVVCIVTSFVGVWQGTLAW